MLLQYDRHRRYSLTWPFSLTLLITLVILSYSVSYAKAMEIAGPPVMDKRMEIAKMEQDMVRRFGWDAERARGSLAKPAARPQVGAQRNFWAFRWDIEQFYQVSATCRAVGEHAYLFVENECWNITVRQTDVEAMLTAFDEKTPADPNRGIYRIDVEAFGIPPNVDGDPKIYILILDIKDNPGPGPCVAGYFAGVNEFSDWEARRLGYRSNQMEILYVDCNPLDVASAQSHRVVAHEFQHMIHFNLDPEEETWVNEGCSTFAEFVNGYGMRLPDNFKDDPANSLVDWNSDLADYEQVGMFVDYLFEHWGGAATVKALVANPAHGVEGVTATLSQQGYSEGFDQVFGDWVIANYLDDETIGDGRYGYVNYDLSGRYRFSDTRVHSSYPADGNGSVACTATNYIAFTGMEDSIEVDFDGANMNDFHLRVIRIDSGESPQVDEIPLDNWNDGTSVFPGLDRIVLVPIIRRMANFPVPYTYSAKLRTEPIEGIVSVSPPPGVSGVPLNTNVSITFSAPYDPSTVEVDFGQYPEGEHIRSEDGKTLTVVPSDTLEPYTTYAICVKAGVKDTAGNLLLGEDYSWSFTTGAAGEITELAYDDGDYNLYLYWNFDGEGSGVRFTPLYLPARLVSANFYLTGTTFGNAFLVRVFKDDGTGLPGKELMQPMKVEAPGVGWFNVDLQQKDIEVDGDFHIMFQVLSDTVSTGSMIMLRLSRPYFGAEDHPPISGRSWDRYLSGSFFSKEFRYRKVEEYDYAIRAVIIPTCSSVEEPDAFQRRAFFLSQNYPNPFNASTMIIYEIPEAGHVALDIYNILGQKVRTLVDRIQPVGKHTACWDGTDAKGKALASGVYLYQLRSRSHTLTNKMILLR